MAALDSLTNWIDEHPSDSSDLLLKTIAHCREAIQVIQLRPDVDKMIMDMRQITRMQFTKNVTTMKYE